MNKARHLPVRLVHARPIKVENSIHHRNGPSRCNDPTRTSARPILAVMKVYRVLPACKPAAMTELASLGGRQLLKHLLQQGWVLFRWKFITTALAHLFRRVKKDRIRSNILWSRLALPGLYGIIDYGLTDRVKVKILLSYAGHHSDC